MIYNIKTGTKKLLADTITPVGAYMKLRDHFACPILLESSDYHGANNALSYICLDPMATFQVVDNKISKSLPDGSLEEIIIQDRSVVLNELEWFRAAFTTSEPLEKFTTAGLFGYMSFEALRHFEDIDLSNKEVKSPSIPEILYHFYRFVMVFDHFKNELYIFEHALGEHTEFHGLGKIEDLLKNTTYPSYSFSTQGGENSNYEDDEFVSILEKGKHHCQIGDVFQIVLSRGFEQNFKGDEFNVYRTLRSINPSPYLFYFDFGNFKLLGSSPEAQITIDNEKASIYPIAGTFKRTGNDKLDAELAQKLCDDTKENAEHVMLVDLARNDLSKNSHRVEVETFKEIQFYSHVIHMVSKVNGHLEDSVSPLQMMADTFPAGTLSGAPKYKAVELIDQYENKKRGFYGGAIGFMGIDGNFNHAIIIRSMLSYANKLYFQAGAGVVALSDSKSELEEVNNKVRALREAIKAAESR